MRVLLVRPPLTRLRGTGHINYFPLGIGYLAGTLLQEGHEVSIYNADNAAPNEPPPQFDKASVFENRSAGYYAYQSALKAADHFVWNEIKEVLRTCKPDLVGLSVLTVEAGSARRVSQLVKETLPGTPVIWGGVHPTYMAKQCLQYPEVDYCMRGEGELAFAEFVRELEAGGNPGGVESISLMRDGEYVENPLTKLAPDINDLTVARGATLFPERVSRAAWGSVIGSRGCPWRCTFCTSPEFWQKRFRHRTPDNLLAEIKEIKETYGSGVFTFWDDVFSIRRRNTIELCQKLRRDKLRIAWKTATRANLLDEELLGEMRKAGCVQLEIGVETGSPTMSKKIHKDVSLQQIRDAIGMINRSGIASGTFFMAGFPQETEKELLETFEFMKSIDAVDIVLNVFDPQPGAGLFDEAVARGMVDPDRDWSDFPLWPDAHYCEGIERERFDELVREIAHWCWEHNNSWPVLLRRMRPKVISILKSDPAALGPKAMHFIKSLVARRTTVLAS